MPAIAGSVWNAIKVAGNEARNMAVHVGVMRKIGGREGPQVAVVF
jgi:hypothetical protein